MSFIGEQIVPGIVVDPIVKAWRIQFKIGIAPGENVLRKFNAPEEYFAVAEEVPIDALMAADDKDGFVLAFMRPARSTAISASISCRNGWRPTVCRWN
ncbi:hypothetical protein [Methylogaea oryzae]|uniref:hypothetical protein n=1 Tax=Methylogaea oryzae TaxID=1295382 RepID=UPI0006D0B238|nr:hypothetical protein [Methylogaea oryzae]